MNELHALRIACSKQTSSLDNKWSAAVTFAVKHLDYCVYSDNQAATALQAPGDDAIDYLGCCQYPLTTSLQVTD